MYASVGQSLFTIYNIHVWRARNNIFFTFFFGFEWSAPQLHFQIEYTRPFGEINDRTIHNRCARQIQVRRHWNRSEKKNIIIIRRQYKFVGEQRTLQNSENKCCHSLWEKCATKWCPALARLRLGSSTEVGPLERRLPQPPSNHTCPPSPLHLSNSRCDDDPCRLKSRAIVKPFYCLRS